MRMPKSAKTILSTNKSLPTEIRTKIESLSQDEINSMQIMYILNKLNKHYMLPFKETLPAMTKDGIRITNILFENSIKPSKKLITTFCNYFFEKNKSKYINKIMVEILYANDVKQQLNTTIKNVI